MKSENLSLGRLQKIDLRTIWNNEASDFTPWLAQEQNLALLGDTLGIELELEAQERDVGPFRADILCKDTLTSAWVLIENQLERTDHSHMGQLITYAAGLDAVTIVWVAERFTEEHRAALDWLNAISDETANFFGLEVELWKIGDSAIAPKFNVVSKPNDWFKSVASAARQGSRSSLTDTQQLQLEYWIGFQKYLRESGRPVKIHKPVPQNLITAAIGRSTFNMIIYLNTRDNRMGMGLVTHGPDGKAHFNLLHDKREEIENALGDHLDWRENPGKKESHIYLHRRNIESENRSKWGEYHNWMADKLETFDRVFRPLVKNLDANDYQPPDSEDDGLLESFQG